MSVEQLIERRRRVMGSSYVFYQEPIHIVRGEGVFSQNPKVSPAYMGHA